MKTRRNLIRFAIAFCAGAVALSMCAGAVAATAPVKTVRFAFLIAETEFDPARVSDLYSNYVNEAIFDPLLTYDYLARPAKLVPNTVSALPEVTGGGRIYTFHVRPGIYFAEDAAFGGKRRELTAGDYAYSLRRLFDPKLRSPWLFYVEGKVAGGDAARAAAQKSGRFDYDAPIAGLETPDRYTLRITLREPDYNFIYVLATVTTGAMAREVVERYGDEIGAHPVGTGPFLLKDWKRSSRIVLEANPGFREMFYEADPGDNPDLQRIYAQMRGKRLPQVQRVEVSVIEESQPRWLAFLNSETDYVNVPLDFINMAFPGGKLAPNLARRGMFGSTAVDPDLVYMFFNMDDPVVGGYTPEKVALRRAISLAYNVEEDIRLIRNGSAVPAQSAIPPGVVGYDPNFRSDATDYSPARAKALLDMFGYIDRDGDGYRENPDGSQLTIEKAAEPDQLTRQFSELLRKDMDAIGVRVTFRIAKWPDLNKQAKLGKLMMWQLAWSADYPDGENFLQNLYGKAIGSSNDARFNLPAFDKLIEQARTMPPGAERTRLYQEMNKLMIAYAPWKVILHRVSNNISQPWLIGFRKHPILNAPWLYLDVDDTRRTR